MSADPHATVDLSGRSRPDRARAGAGLRAAWRAWGERLAQRPSLMLFACSLGAQGVSLAASPLLTRLYSPGDFGTFGLLTALVMVGVPLATGRIELAIPGARDPRDGYAILRLCLGWMVGALLVVAGLAWATTRLHPTLLPPPLGDLWFFIPLALGCVALVDVLGIEASRQNRLVPLAISKLWQVGAGIGSQLLLGLAGFTAWGLLLGFVINQAAGCAGLLRRLVLRHPGRFEVPWARLRALWVEHRRYPLLTSWTQFLDACTKWALQLVFTLLWGPEVGGFIFLTDRIVGRPMQLVSGSLLPVYIAAVGDALRSDPKRAVQALYRNLRRQAPIVVVWAACVAVLAPFVVRPLFGEQWAAAVPFVQLMTLAIAPAAILQCVAHTLQLVRRQRLDAALVLTNLVATVAALGGAHAAGLSAEATLGVYAAVQNAYALLTLATYRHALRGLPATPRSAPERGDRR